MLLENIKLAFTGLMANKIRSFLTMLGVIIGIAAVIAIMTVSSAMQRSVMSMMGSMGTNRIEFFLTQKGNDTAVRDTDKTKDYMSEDDFKDLMQHFQGQLEGLALERSLGNVTLEKGDGRTQASINLSGGNSLDIRTKNLTMLAGRTLSLEDQKRAAKVALVSDRYAEKMIGPDVNQALGQVIEIPIDNKFYTYTIVGVYQFNVSAAFGGNMADMPTDVYIPLATANLQVKDSEYYDSFTLFTAEAADPETLCPEIQNYLNNGKYLDNDTYMVFGYSMKEQIRQTTSMLSSLKLAFVAVGAIALLVGGIGVMNIMVVSITERTREIGTRKALGATNLDIRLQFITEAVMICLIGGVIGILLGLGLGMLASSLLHFEGHPSIAGIAVSVLFSMAFGVFFGYYPANKAAKLDPIEALRYE